MKSTNNIYNFKLVGNSMENGKIRGNSFSGIHVAVLMQRKVGVVANRVEKELFNKARQLHMVKINKMTVVNKLRKKLLFLVD